MGFSDEVGGAAMGREGNKGGVQKNFNHRLKKYLRKGIGRFSQTNPLRPVIAVTERFGETT